MRLHAILLLVFCGFVNFRIAAQIPITLSTSLPASIDNSIKTCFPAIVDQGMRESCASATGIGYIFSYEINRARGLSGKVTANSYPFFHTYDFLNEGDETADPNHEYYRQFLPAWRIVRENGIPDVNDFGTSDLNSTRWLSGYDKYYRAMRNRVDKIDSFSVADTMGLKKMKQWLTDRGNGSSPGGILLFTAIIYGTQEVLIPSGPQSGKIMVKAWGNDPNSTHAMAIVGYNDSVRYDFNGDGKYTNDLDISTEAGARGADGRVTMADWEVGAFMAANSWGTASWDNGICYAPYRLLAASSPNGGLLSSNRVYILTVREPYVLRLALKATITDNLRNTIALSVGVSTDPAATAPAKIRRFERQFTYAGGAYPLCGKGASASIEIGIDISDLLDSIPGLSSGTFFLRVDSKGGTGTVDSLSLMDYLGGSLRQTKSGRTNVSITPGTIALPATTYIGISADLSGVVPQVARMSKRNRFTARYEGKRVVCSLPIGVRSDVLVTSVQGRVFQVESIEEFGSGIALVQELPAGIYFVQVRMDDGKVMAGAFSVVR